MLLEDKATPVCDVVSSVDVLTSDEAGVDEDGGEATVVDGGSFEAFGFCFNAAANNSSAVTKLSFDDNRIPDLVVRATFGRGSDGGGGGGGEFKFPANGEVGDPATKCCDVVTGEDTIIG